jgi:hypothetical protein
MLLACLGLAVPLVVMQSGTTASAAPGSWPTSMAITALRTDLTDGTSGSLPGSKPNVLVGINTDIHVTVTFSSDLPSDATLKVTSTLGTAATPIPGTVTAPGGSGSSVFTFDVHFDKAVNDVGLIATVTKGPMKGMTTGASERFDVLTAFGTVSGSTNPNDPGFTAGFGGDDGSCGNAVDADGKRVCEVLVLPEKPASDVFFSTGLCSAAYSCNTKGALVQTLFADGGAYGQFDPATLIVKCDKSLCGTGPIHKVNLYYSLIGNGGLDQTPVDCPAKNTLPDDLQPCIDYVQSKRDGSGDTHLYLLFAKDLRGGIG